MSQKFILGGVAITAALLVTQFGLAQEVVFGHCNSGDCHGAVGHPFGGHRIGQGNGILGPNTGEQGSFAAWGWHSSWGDYWARNQAAQRPWHGGYYWMRTGQPTALVVPPVVTMQQNYSWGVSQNTMTPVYHQFGGVPPNGAGGGMFRGTPYWPTHTEQFGVYPVRGPW